MHRLTDEQAECIKNQYQMRKSVREIAETCGVSKNTVARYVQALKEPQSTPAPASHTPSPIPLAPSGPDASADEVLEKDTKFLVDMMKARLDPRAPILTKWVENTMWWYHFVFDFSLLVLPKVLNMLPDTEIDIKNPEATARRAAGRLEALLEEARAWKEKLAGAEARVKQLEAELEAYRARQEEVMRLLDEYEYALERLKATIDALTVKVTETIKFIVAYVPRTMNATERATYYHVVIPKIRELWGVEVKPGG